MEAVWYTFQVGGMIPVVLEPGHDALVWSIILLAIVFGWLLEGGGLLQEALVSMQPAKGATHLVTWIRQRRHMRVGL